ncbi:Putative AAA+ ATPase domain, ABC transporter type 1, transmembrane domain-containing protein [Septoria linicola]|uniref:AAA+ ATPase domain, ABC transporter type 1, transmembrane domain-containing protein n=1 Tax=Septoria linicola TaxID=215465 RepID=A0A9Q9B3I4_9PEZI|nr:putative AAA+ ATPase domain, ABC transporter type 1, transmembrane domain-containing protein [Septoria linicola]USW57535.1 Putative AAA+ ATPase domain, ABC transporter type 1, transmembrane domain-containing protein [Septoria linicola]
MEHCSLRADDRLGPVVGQGCHDNFDFTLLFEESFLSILPAALFLLLVPLRASHLRRQEAKVLRNGSKSAKQIAIIALACTQLAILIAWSLRPLQRTKTSIPAAAISFLASLALLYLSSLEHAKTVRPSSIINSWILGSLLLDLPQARTLWLRPGPTALPIAFTISVCAKVVILYLEARNKRHSLFPRYRILAPETLVSLYNRTSLWWLNPLFWTGYRSFLSIDGLYAIDADLSSKDVESSFAREWSKQSRESRWQLLYATALSVKWTLLGVVIPRLCLSAFKLSQPLLIARITSLLGRGINDEDRNDAKGLVGAAALIYVSVAVTTALYQRQLHRMVTKIRGSLVSAVYAATLHLDSAQLSDNAALTLVTADVNRVCSSLKTIDDLFATPIEVAVAIFLLERQIGVSCVAPVGLAIAITLLSFANSNTAISMQKSWLAAVSTRVAYTSAVLGCPKGFKMLGLTEYFIDRIQALRVHELAEYAQYRKYVTWRNIFSAIPHNFAPPLTLMMFVLIEGRQALNPTTAFTTLALVALVTAPTMEMIHAVPQLQTALASLDRVQHFLRLDGGGATSGPFTPGMDLLADHGSIELSSLPDKGSTATNESLIQLIDAFITLGEKVILGSNSVTVHRNTLNMVVGAVGSGKSTLLKAIIGDLQLSAGTRRAKPNMTFSYCAQDAWLPNDTIRNIIVGQSQLDETWLATVIQACALEADLNDFAAGDNTLVGAKGVSLSGGQRQRVALARAVYSRRHVLVADDVFSGLDTNTASHVFSHVFGTRGLCKIHGISVVLATHSQKFLQEADHVIALGENGKITEQGTFKDLVSANGYVHGLKLDIASQNADEPELETDEPQNKRVLPSGADKIDLAQQDLARKTGDTTVYKYYFKSIGWKLGITLSITIVGFAIGEKAPDLWVRFWSEAESSGREGRPLAYWIAISFLFALICVGSAGTHIWVMLVHAVPKSSAQLHKQLLDSVMHATYNFFVNTDPGVTLNRFSNDMSIIEGELAGAFMQFTDGAASCLAGAALIAAGADYAAAAMPFVMAVLYMIQKFYLCTSRQMRFLELESQAPLLTHVTETLAGVTTIRAFGWQSHSHDKCLALLDKSQRAYYLMLCIQRWLNFVLALVTAAVAVIVVSMALLIPSASSAGAIGVSLLGILNFSWYLSYVINAWTALETSLGAIARCKNFEATTASEDLPNENAEPPADWPSRGVVDIRNISAAYNSGQNVLSAISLSIAAGEKIGICGRSGSGKSSLLLTILRMLDHSSGSIEIDGIELSSIPRHAIRTSLAALPQEIVTFPGSVVVNLDPMGCSSRTQAENALQKVGLHDLIMERGGLDVDMAKLSLSQGQLQLFAIARALLRKSKVLIVDEMSSSVDAATEDRMIDAITQEFAESTVIAVAHRLKTIVNFDRIVVMDGGKIVEVGVPAELLQKTGGAFQAMWNRSS